jgi:DNA-binding transcriptional LysR family regulator
MINAVEKRVGVRLLNRTTRSVSLTEAGAAFLDQVTPGLSAIQGALDMAEKFRTVPSGRVRINASAPATERLLPAVLGFLEAYPQVTVEITTEGRLVDIVVQGFDAGVRLAEAVPQDMVALPFGEDEQFIVVASPAYLQGRRALDTPADLAAHACIRALMPSGKPLVWEFERHGQTTRVNPDGRLVLGGSGLAGQAAIAGAGLAYVDAWSVREALAAGRLVTVLDAWTPPFPGHRLYYPRQRLPSAAFRAFLDHLQSQRRAST